MHHRQSDRLLPLALVVVLVVSLSIQDSQAYKKTIKSAEFLSPKFVLGPGSVENRYYHDIDFPRGHVFLKSFDAEVVDEAGNSISLHETYLHHWVIMKYYERKENSAGAGPDHLSGRNSGLCQTTLGQYFGLGSETRKTLTDVPDPYGIEIGNPEEIPEGYEEKWLLNVHAIDTRGVEDRLGCTECRCNLYNVTVDEYGRPLRPDYRGGLLCCYDHTQCNLRNGFEGIRRGLYLKYTMKWIEWDPYVIPVDVYILDVTDSPTVSANGTVKHHCLVEYQVESCSVTGGINGECIDNKKISLTMPKGGDLIYGVAHQHTGGIGSALYGEDGRLICASMPIYGNGKEPGNEEGYIVGMSTCYPEPGSVRIGDGETVVLESNYSSSIYHSGVMGLFYLLVAKPKPDELISLRTLTKARDCLPTSTLLWVAGFMGVAIAIAVAIRKRNPKEDGYQIVN